MKGKQLRLVARKIKAKNIGKKKDKLKRKSSYSGKRTEMNKKKRKGNMS